MTDLEKLKADMEAAEAAWIAANDDAAYAAAFVDAAYAAFDAAFAAYAAALTAQEKEQDNG
jgi:hypothetical protein